MCPGELDLIVVADIHHVGKAGHTCPFPERKADLGLELFQRVLARLEGDEKPDVLVLMGDLMDEASADGAQEDLRAIRERAARSGIPTLVVPGNHDGDPEWLLGFFGDRSGEHCVKGYTLFTFADRYGLRDECCRAEHDLEALAASLASHPERPTLALQHNPVYPLIGSDYPYNLKNARAVMTAYERAGIVLSLSGHFHTGQALSYAGGVGYITCPALCEVPFRYLRLKLRGREVTVRGERLALEANVPLCDVHVHTEFAYCGHGITAQAAIERAHLFGLASVALTEHSDQLYTSDEDYHSAKIIEDPDLPRAMRAAGRDRYADYRTFVGKLRSPFVRLGLEIECNSRFEPMLLEEDRDGWDILVGAVHWMTEEMKSRAGGSAEKAFMKLNEALLDCGIDVLAHPFRYFVRQGLKTPHDLYRPLARMLADRGVAAEINFHTNRPDPEFFAICMEEGVRIALGSDSHALHEVGELAPHLRLLRQAGACDADLPNILYPP